MGSLVTEIAQRRGPALDGNGQAFRSPLCPVMGWGHPKSATLVTMWFSHWAGTDQEDHDHSLKVEAGGCQLTTVPAAG